MTIMQNIKFNSVKPYFFEDPMNKQILENWRWNEQIHDKKILV